MVNYLLDCLLPHERHAISDSRYIDGFQSYMMCPTSVKASLIHGLADTMLSSPFHDTSLLNNPLFHVDPISSNRGEDAALLAYERARAIGLAYGRNQSVS